MKAENTEDGNEPPLTLAQAEELDRRLEEARRNPQTGIPWEQLKKELEQKHGLQPARVRNLHAAPPELG
jgi:putative addiction module component (TIGR02574 family)